MQVAPGALAECLSQEPWGALLGHSSSCSSSSEPEGPWRTSSYHLLVRVFIWMRPWWRSWGRRHNQALVSQGQVRVRAEEGGGELALDLTGGVGEMGGRVHGHGQFQSLNQLTQAGIFLWRGR